ncbi:DUF4268 domain-containing protein [Aureivirga sp. CE67]|uniref:DUF4268 domain-containing protein n=1 Tax=Aureivirga sp. CE67 TaxID=1788983 RepID=UPI0018C9F71F|nr:DUF4268 domain-containing protein [Aureivirga sp. CE67]
MFSKEESRRLKQEFWTSFGKSFPRKWILYNTKIKDVAFKFYFDRKSAMVALDIECRDLESRIRYYEKFESFKKILEEDYIKGLIFEDCYVLENGKEISRIYIQKDHVCIHNKKTWQETMEFLNENMEKFEEFYYMFEDVIKG